MLYIKYYSSVEFVELTGRVLEWEFKKFKGNLLQNATTIFLAVIV